MGSEMETVEQRLKSFTVQLQTECGILERLVYKHKNQHRRCSYFQFILKVRRDLKLLKLANLEEIFDASFLVINGNRPKHKVQLLESLKKRRCNGGKYNFLERLLGVARLLSQMVEPLLRAAMEISTLLARSFFLKFSVTILAVLARIRVLVQQILLDAVLVYNTVSSLSRREQTVKLNQEGFEVFREYYPRKEEATIMLECVWQADKYALVERTHKNDTGNQDKDSQEDVLLNVSNIQYQNIEAILGVDESGGAMVAEHGSAGPINTEENASPSGVNNDENWVREASATAGASSANIVSIEDMLTDSSVPMSSETNTKISVEDGSCNITRTADSKSVSQEAGLPTSSSAPPVTNPVKLKSETKKKVAFVPVKPPAPPAKNESMLPLKGIEKNGDDTGDPFYYLLTGGNKKSRLF